MLRLIPFACLCMVAALVPFIPSGSAPERATEDFPGWPEHLEGIPLQPLPLDGLTESFSDHFPGRIACFGWGGKRVIMRWVHTPTRKLHPAVDCFRGDGYSTHDTAPGVDVKGREWGRFVAERQDARLRVSECIWEQGGRSWGDVSAWFWSAAGKRSVGPWWAMTIVEPYEEGVDE